MASGNARGQGALPEAVSREAMELLSNYGRGKVTGAKFQSKAQTIITRAESGPCYSQETGAALQPRVEVPLFMLPIMLTETLPDNQKRARICLYAKALSILVRNPGVADETFTLRGTSIKIKDMLQDTVLNWTRMCCLFCLEGCQPLPPQVVEPLKALSTDTDTDPFVRLLTTWAVACGVQFQHLPQGGIGVPTSDAALVEGKTTDNLAERIWLNRVLLTLAPAARRTAKAHLKASMETVIAESEAFMAAMDKLPDSGVLISG